MEGDWDEDEDEDEGGGVGGGGHDVGTKVGAPPRRVRPSPAYVIAPNIVVSYVFHFVQGTG